MAFACPAPRLSLRRANAARLLSRPRAGLTGTYIKDAGASESAAATAALFELSWPVRAALPLLTSLELIDEPQTFGTRINVRS